MDLVSSFYRDREPLRRRIRDLAHDPQATTLDVGCKTGDLTRVLAGRVGRVVATDIVLHDEWRRPDPGIVFLASDACALPFRSASFDLLVAGECLQYIPTPEAALDEFRRVLRDGGRLVLSFPEPGPVATWLDPYNLVNAIKRVFAPRAPRGMFTPFYPAHRILGHAADGWQCTEHERRGTVVFIYAAWLIDKLQWIRTALLRKGATGRAIGQWIFRPAIHALFLVMRVDYSLALGPLSYNNVIRLRKTAGTG